MSELYNIKSKSHIIFSETMLVSSAFMMDIFQTLIQMALIERGLVIQIKKHSLRGST